MKRLIIGNTFSQIMIAIQMKITLFSEDDVDLWISDHSVKADDVVANIEEIKIFRHVQFYKTKLTVYRQKISKGIWSIIQVSFGKVEDMVIENYDEIIFYNKTINIYKIADWYNKINHYVKWSRMEEGVHSYYNDYVVGRRVKLVSLIRKFTKRPDIIQLISRYYCYFPELKELYSGCEIVRIPVIQTNYDKYKYILQRAFNYTEEKIEQKYIYLASSSDVDNHAFGETELVIKIAESVGKENLIVKMHPRDCREVYEGYGIKVMEKSSVPWEVIQIVNDLNEKILITATSGAFINASAILKQNIYGYLLFSEIKEFDDFYTDTTNNIKIILNKLHNENSCLNIREGGLSEL